MAAMKWASASSAPCTVHSCKQVEEAMSTARIMTLDPADAADNRRREERVPEKRPAWLARGSISTKVEMVNLSKSGACFLSTRPLALGQMVRLQIGHGVQMHVVDGRVVRYRERSDGLHEIGLRLELDRKNFEIKQRFPRRT